MNWINTVDESKKRWEANADFWDQRMGEHSNRYYRELIRPGTEELLSIQKNDFVLDIACGNGNFSRRLAELGAKVTAFDYSIKMIEHAKMRCKDFPDSIDFKVIDATKYDELIAVGKNSLYDKAVSNMALMDIADISPLVHAVYDLLKQNGVFVFSISHPCFQNPHMRKIIETEDVNGEIVSRNAVQVFNYISSCFYEGMAIENQPTPHIYYHRPLSELFKICFEAGFVLDGFKEPIFEQNEDDTDMFEWSEIPHSAIIRLFKR